jgi:uncharacterized protein YjbJ (UPF0337 family)
MSRIRSRYRSKARFGPSSSGNLSDVTEERTGMDKDRIEGSLKEAEGKLTDDELREKQGQAQQKWGETKDDADEALDRAKDEVDERT